MDYQGTIQQIDETKRQHHMAVRDLARVLKDFAHHGWHNEHLADDHYRREHDLYCAVNNLIARLPGLAQA